MVELDKLSIIDFAKELGSSSPAPGGGSTAALAGALSCGLIGMVAKIAQKRAKDSENNDKLEEIIKDSEQARERFIVLINDDTAAFNEIMNSYKMPKENETEKQNRSNAIQNATKHAAEVPLSTAELALQTLVWVSELTKLGSAQTITDTGVAGLMAYSAVTGAVWNVKINLGAIKDEEFVSDKRKKVDEIQNATSKVWLEVQESVENMI